MGSHTLETVALNDAFASASGGFHAALWAGFEAHEVVPATCSVSRCRQTCQRSVREEMRTVQCYRWCPGGSTCGTRCRMQTGGASTESRRTVSYDQ